MPLLKPLSIILPQQNLLSRSLSFLFLFTVLDFVKIKYHLLPPILEIYSMQKLSYTHATFSLLIVLAQCNLANASTAPFTPKTAKEMENCLSTTFKPNTEVRKQLQATAGFETDEKVFTFFSNFLINDAYNEVKNSDGFAKLTTLEKQRLIWGKISENMTETAIAALGNNDRIKEHHINKTVNNITFSKFSQDWIDGDWATIISTPQPSPTNTDKDVDDKTKPDAAATSKSPAGTSSDSSTPPPFDPTGGTKTPKAGVDNGGPKTPNPDSGKSPKQGTPKTPSPVDDPKKSFKLSEYRKTIIAGIAFVGISAWLYSKYNHMETQNSMNAGTAA